MSIQGTAIAAGLVFAVIIAGIAVAGSRKKEGPIMELGRYIDPYSPRSDFNMATDSNELPKKSCGCGAK
jgi:hypothetical protein